MIKMLSKQWWKVLVQIDYSLLTENGRNCNKCGRIINFAKTKHKVSNDEDMINGHLNIWAV